MSRPGLSLRLRELCVLAILAGQVCLCDMTRYMRDMTRDMCDMTCYMCDMSHCLIESCVSFVFLLSWLARCVCVT